MAWPAQACFKLTVMRSQRPQLYEHSLCMMLVAVFLGVREKLDDTQLAQLAAAACCTTWACCSWSPAGPIRSTS
jgi:hypothetical protein